MIGAGRWLTRQHTSAAWLQGGWGAPHWYQTGLPAPLPPGGYLAFPPVFTSIDAISSDIARLPFRHFRREGIRRVEVDRSAALRVLEEPNGYQLGFDLLKQLIVCQLFRGNGYLYARRNRRFEIDELHVLDPDNIWPYRSGSEVFYRYGGGDDLADLDSGVMLTTREVMHHRMMPVQHGLIGIPPLVAAALSSSAGMAILRQSERFFNKMARPSGVLRTPGRLDRQRAEEIKERWQAVYGGETNSAGEVAVLEHGLEWQSLTMTSIDAQLIEQLRYTAEDVARVYRVPIFILGDLTKVNYNSSEQLVRIYHDYCLGVHMDALQRRLSHFFGMNGREEWLEFDLDELFKTDMANRIQALARAVQGGVRTPNEARAVEGLNPIDGGDTVFLQAQMTPVTQLAVPAPPPPALPAPTPPAAPPAPTAPARGIDEAALCDELMLEVFGTATLPAEVTDIREAIYGRRPRAAA